MTWWESIILGILQGLTEFLPVSSSGHLEIAKEIFNIELKEDLSFTVVVHGATVLSTIVVFRKDILQLLFGFFDLKQYVPIPRTQRRSKFSFFHFNESTSYLLKIAVSMFPVMVLGVFFKDEVESFFGNGLLLVGFMLILTAILLTLATYLGKGGRAISFRDAFIIGCGQALAVLPGLSRSGTTIATGLLLGNEKSQIARFSFLMVLIPIIGENILSLFDGGFSVGLGGVGVSLALGFVSAFISGYFACTFMINLVKKGKLVYFALYCLFVGGISIYLYW